MRRRPALLPLPPQEPRRRGRHTPPRQTEAPRRYLRAGDAGGRAARTGEEAAPAAEAAEAAGGASAGLKVPPAGAGGRSGARPPIPAAASKLPELSRLPPPPPLAAGRQRGLPAPPARPRPPGRRRAPGPRWWMRPPRPGQPPAAVQAAAVSRAAPDPAGAAGGGAAASFPAGLKEDGEPRRAEDAGRSASTSHGVL